MGCSPYESTLPAQAPANAHYRDEYESMDFKMKGGFPPEPPPYTSPVSTPLGEPPEYPPPPSPATKPQTLPFECIPPVPENDRDTYDDLNAEHSIYQEVDDYLVPGASCPNSPSNLYALPETDTEESK